MREPVSPLRRSLAWHVRPKPVVQGVDLSQFLAVFGSACMALQRAAQELHVSGRKQRAGAGWFGFWGIGVAHRISLYEGPADPMPSRPNDSQANEGLDRFPQGQCASVLRTDLARNPSQSLIQPRTGSWCCLCRPLSEQLHQRSIPCGHRQCQSQPCFGA